jgi:hypothetical protein
MSNSNTGTVSITVTGTDVIYVSRQIRHDLREIKKAYSHLIDDSYHERIYDAIEKFLYKQAVDKIGFSIYNPDKKNLVYHEWTYIVLLGDAIPASMQGTEGEGTGGQAVVKVSNLPANAKFTCWVVWSDSFLKLSDDEKELIIRGSGWELPGKKTFKGTYEDSGGFTNNGYYVKGQLGVEVRTYRKDL